MENNYSHVKIEQQWQNNKWACEWASKLDKPLSRLTGSCQIKLSTREWKCKTHQLQHNGNHRTAKNNEKSEKIKQNTKNTKNTNNTNNTWGVKIIGLVKFDKPWMTRDYWIVG